MKKLIYALFVLMLVSCNLTPSKNREDHSKGTPQIIDPEKNTKPGYSMAALYDTSTSEEELEEETAAFYIVVADTSANYYSLRDQMLYLHKSLDIPIDTMGRFYNLSKDLICLPDNDKDELFAGDYLPRRFPSNSLSLEYLRFYQQKAGEKTIALVSGIYDSQSSADSVLSTIKVKGNKAFLIAANIYTGCIH
jgi:hypothetical protein